MIQSWLAKKLITFVMGRTRDGDVRPTLLLDAPDVELTFPGRLACLLIYVGRPVAADVLVEAGWGPNAGGGSAAATAG